MAQVFIGSGLSCLHGASYQLKLLMLFLKRAIDKGYRFYLATEIEAADKFDDVVFQYTEDGKEVLVLIQTKHKQDCIKKIKVEDLLQKLGNNDYNLAKYFISYLKVKYNRDFAGSELRNFILCTNIDFDLDPNTIHVNVRKFKVDTRAPNPSDDIFVVLVEDYDYFFSDGGKRYKFHYESNSTILTLKPIFTRAVNEEIKAFKNTVEKLKGNTEQRHIEKVDKIREWQRQFEQILSGRLEEEMKGYFDTLIFAVNQPNEAELSEIIKDKLSQEFNAIDARNVYSRFHEMMVDWLKDRRGRFLTQDDGTAFFDMLRQEIHGSFLFNVRSPIDSFVGREEELKAIHNLLNQDKGAVITQQISISGMGGIGKTELVRKYILEFGKHYDFNILWIDAQTYETAKESFKELARVVLGISCKDRAIASVVKEIYSFFSKRKCLFVFDNADKFRSDGRISGIDAFLPSYVLPRETNRPKVLITSRNRKWGDIPLIALDVFSKAEALDFITRELDIKDPLQETDVRNLAEKLQYFPLALQQAAAYIKEKNTALMNIRSDFKILDYILKYERETKNLLNFQFPEDSRDLYTKTTFTIMKITIDKIKENKEYGQQAGQILDIISLLAPDNIPVELFLELELIRGDKEMLGSTIQLLRQYSLINSGQVKTLINIHRLLQQVTRIVLKDQNREERTLSNAFRLLKKMFKGINEIRNLSQMRLMLTHSEIFLIHLYNYHNIKQIADSYFLELQSFLNEGYFALGYSLKQKELLEHVLEIQEKHYYGKHLYLVSETLFNLGNAYGALGYPRKQGELLKRALEIKEKHFGSKNYEIVATLVNLGNSYDALGCPQKQVELLKRALQVQEKHFGSDYFEIAPTLVNLGNAYRALGNPRKQEQLLERALKIQKKYYGRYHFTIAVTLVNLGNSYNALGYPQKQVKLLKRALQIQEKHFGRDYYEIGTTLVNLGNAYGALGCRQKQKELLERALNIQEKHYGRNNFNTAVTLASLGNLYGSLGDPNKKIELLTLALNIQVNHYGSNHFEIAATLISLGVAHGELGYPYDQKALLKQALKIQVKHYSRNNFEVAKTLVYLGNVKGVLGNPKKQKVLLEQALRIQEEHYGSKHIYIAQTLVSLGIAYGTLGYPQKQKVLLDRALEIQEKHYGDHHFQLAETLINLGNTYGTLGYPFKQKELLERALDIQRKYYRSNSIKTAKTIVFLGNAYGALHFPEEKKKLLENALKIQEKHFGSDHLEIAVTLANLGNAYGALGDPLKQMELSDRALEIQDKKNCIDTFLKAMILINLGNSYGALGDPATQKEYLERALDIQKKANIQFEMAETLLYLSNAYGALGDLLKQKESLKWALKIQEKRYGFDHLEIVSTICKLGHVYGQLDRPHKQNMFLERALKIQVKHYGINHFIKGETEA